jgi:BlaI family transcriptional regulator, penicillinase repressor
MGKQQKVSLSGLEHRVMEIVWAHGQATAEQVRLELESESPLKDSTIRTVLRRLEEKGFVTHEVDARTYVYRPAVEQQSAAVRAVRQIIDRFCGGSVETLLVGMVADRMVDEQQLKELADRISAEQTNEGDGDGARTR